MSAARSLLLTAMFLTLPARTLAQDQDAQDVAALLTLQQDIQVLLPKSWEAIATATGEEIEGVDSPALVIRTRMPVTTATQHPNPAPDQGPTIRQRGFELSYFCVPFMTQAEVEAGNGRNVARTKLRNEFAEKHLREVSVGFKGARPIPPLFYTPENKEQQKALLQYAFLWVRTKPEAIPSHFHKKLSFRKVPEYHTRLKDPERSKEYQRITEDLAKVIRPYVLTPE